MTRRWRRATALTIVGLLAGCGGPAGILDTSSRTIPDNYGLVVTDEPTASAAGREVLAAGGSAVDAGIAAYFALAVTLPGSAGLAGGGVCLAHDGSTTTVEALDFSVGPATAGGFGAPGNLRGMFALHARYGRLRWEQTVLPAERLARFGVPVSRAVAQAIEAGADRIAADPAARRIFLRRDGAPPREGDRIVQTDLAGLLERVRARGIGDLGTPLGRAIADGLRDRDLQEDARAIADARPVWLTALETRVGNHGIHFPPMPVAAGARAHAAWTAADRRAPSATPCRDEVASLVVVDRGGSALACTFSMNGAFGSGRMFPGSGLFLAAPTDGARDGRQSRTPVLMANRFTGDVLFAAAASGGTGASDAIVRIGRALVVDERPYATAFGAERGDDPVRVNLAHCPRGIKRDADTCYGRADPRGFGLAVDSGS